MMPAKTTLKGETMSHHKHLILEERELALKYFIVLHRQIEISILLYIFDFCLNVRYMLCPFFNGGIGALCDCFMIKPVSCNIMFF